MEALKPLQWFAVLIVGTGILTAIAQIFARHARSYLLASRLAATASLCWFTSAALNVYAANEGSLAVMHYCLAAGSALFGALFWATSIGHRRSAKLVAAKEKETT